MDGTGRMINSEEEAADYARRLAETLGLRWGIASAHTMAFRPKFKKRLAGALTYAVLSNGEYPIYIYDNSFWGLSGKSGLTATNKAIHTNLNNKKIYWADITGFTTEIKGLTVNSAYTHIHISRVNGETVTLRGCYGWQKQQLAILRLMWLDFQ
jgi:hypothetical protein